MKKIIIFCLSMMIVVSINSCEDGNNTIDEVLGSFENGAVLRTLEIISGTLNSSKPESEWRVSLEEQDIEDGGLFKSVEIYVSLRDLTPGNGNTITENAFIKSIPASEFTDGPHGLPRGEVAATFGEAEAAMGLSPEDTSPGDLYVFETKLVLTDGRVFGEESAAGIITGGFFSSPFSYNALVVCSPEPGEYRVEMHDSFGDGWQTTTGNGGDGITITIDGEVVEIGMCTPYESNDYECSPWPDDINDPTTEFNDATVIVTIPVGAELAVWNFPGDNWGEISFEVYAPNGDLLVAVGVGEGVEGVLPILVCANNM